MSAPARKQKVIVPTLRERADALLDEILDASREEAIEVIEAWKTKLSGALDALAEERRPKQEGSAIPVGWLRMQFDIRGGHCLCRSYLAVLEKDN
jgi:hypothetical protein